MDPADEAVMLNFCRRRLGPCRIVADHSWPHRQAVVLEVADEAGQGWIAKRSRDAVHHRNETTAYRDWVSALDGLSPTMVAHDDDLGVLLLTLEPGEVGETADIDAHRQAGALIRGFHTAAPPRLTSDLLTRLTDRTDAAVADGGTLFSRADVALVRRRLRALDRLPPVSFVPTHQDNQPRNWLTDEAGTVRLLDFGLSTWDVWVRDLVRLTYWDWADNPALATAFLAGYGRALSEVDERLLAGLGAVIALRTVLWARDHRDESFAERGRRTLEILRQED